MQLQQKIFLKFDQGLTISLQTSRLSHFPANFSLIPFPSPHDSRQVARGEFLAIK
jgi:hypothetical protein